MINWTDKNRVKGWVRKLFWLGVVITLAIFLLNFILIGFGVYGDGIGYYTPLRSLIFDGDLRIYDEYEYLSHSASNFGGGARVDQAIPQYSKYTLGLGLILSPFFALGHFATLIANILGLEIDPNGLTWSYELFYCLGSIILGIFGLIACYKAARLFFSQTASVLAVAGIWFASPLSFYLTLEVSMSHAVSQFLISIFLYICISTVWVKQRRQQILLGLVLGLGTFVRPQNILFAIVPITMIVWNIINRVIKANQIGINTPWKGMIKLPDITSLAVIGFVACLMQLPQIFIYQWQYNSFFKIPYLEEGGAEGYESSFNWIRPQISNVLFSGHRGLFFWHPVLFLSIIGLILVFQKLPMLVTSFLLAFGLQVYLVASWWCWWQGSSFGGRMFINCSLIFVWGLAAFWDNLSCKRLPLIGVGVTLFLMGWNALLILQYESGMIPSEDAVTIREVLHNQLFAIPHFMNHLFNR
ncbi:MAG: glycosyltransferase family 39 protein [cyanobacterium endosymbiont of Rhopalodia gibba]